MNIVLYVFALISAMSILTYARLQTVLTSLGTKEEYTCYIEDSEQTQINSLQTNQYNKHKGTGRKGGPGERIDASSYLNLIVLTNRNIREKNPVYFQTAKNLFLRLIEGLYEEQEFYESLKETYQNPAEALLSQILTVTEAKPVKNTYDLKGLDLENPDLQELWAKMLEGGASTASSIKCQIGSPNGYRSLLDFVRAKETIQPLRVSMVPKEMLLAIYQDERIVDNIILKRKEFQNQSGTIGSTEQQVASNAFESLFKSRLPKDMNPDNFNFSISQSSARN